MKRCGYSNRRIAKVLKKSHSMINDEVKRGLAKQKKIVNLKTIYIESYYAETGQVIYERHRLNSSRPYKLLIVESFIQYARKKIREKKWSPDTIVGRALKEKDFSKKTSVCVKTLYNYIDQGLILDVNNLNLWLKLSRNTKKKKVSHHRRILDESIEKRPQEINDRTTFGHWEIDTILGHKTKDEPALLTLTERLTRYQIILKIRGKHEEAVMEGLKHLCDDNPYFPHLFKVNYE